MLGVLGHHRGGVWLIDTVYLEVIRYCFWNKPFKGEEN